MVTGIGVSITLILTFLIKFLFVVFIVGLLGGFLIVAKNYVFTPSDLDNFKSTFKVAKPAVAKKTCCECGREVNPDWKSCPYCGTAIEN